MNWFAILLIATTGLAEATTKKINTSDFSRFALNPLNSGFPQALDPVKKQIIDDDQNYIFVLISHPEEALNKITAANLFTFLFQSSDRKMVNAGHVQLAWSCMVKGKRWESAIGFGGDIENKSFRLAINGGGLRPILRRFKDSYFESPEIVSKKIVRAVQSDGLSVLAINAKSSCQTVLNEIWKSLNYQSRIYFQLGHLNQSHSSGENCTSIVIKWLTPLKGNLGGLLSQAAEKHAVSKKWLINYDQNKNKTNNWKKVEKVFLLKTFILGLFDRDVQLTLISPSSLLSYLSKSNWRQSRIKIRGKNASLWSI